MCSSFQSCTLSFVSVIPSFTYMYIVYSAGTKVELHIWNNDKVKCHVFFILSFFERILIINGKGMEYG